MMSLETSDVSGEKRSENIDSIEDENVRGVNIDSIEDENVYFDCFEDENVREVNIDSIEDENVRDVNIGNYLNLVCCFAKFQLYRGGQFY